MLINYAVTITIILLDKSFKTWWNLDGFPPGTIWWEYPGIRFLHCLEHQLILYQKMQYFLFLRFQNAFS